MGRIRSIAARDDGSILLETALGIALILSVALPFASLVSYATYAARDLAAVQTAIRDAARSATVPPGGDIAFTCGPALATSDGPCAPAVAHGSYLTAAKDTAVSLPFGLTLHTNAKAVARVG